MPDAADDPLIPFIALLGKFEQAAILVALAPQSYHGDYREHREALLGYVNQLARRIWVLERGKPWCADEGPDAGV